MYITPGRFRSMGLGIDLSEVDDATLRSYITRASAMVDSYCAIPMQPTKYDFRGGTIVGEQHRWRIPQTPFELGSRRFYPWHQPLLSIQQFRIYVTNTQYVEIDPTELYIQNSEGYAEVVSLALTSVGLFNALIIPNVGLATPTAVMNYTYGFRFSVTGETLDDTDAFTYSSQNNWWATTPAPVIYVNGSVDVSGTIDYNEGSVRFPAPLTADDVVTADYTYRLPAAIAEATALLIATQIGEAGLRAAGMTSLNSIKMEELELRRSPSGRAGSAASSTVPVIPDDVRTLLSDFGFFTVRGGVA